MCTTNFYKSFSKNIEQSAVENSISTYVCYAPDGLFWLNMYELSGLNFDNAYLYTLQSLVKRVRGCVRISIVVIILITPWHTLEQVLVL